MIRKNVIIKGLNLFGTEVKLTECADDTTLFFRNLRSLKVLLQTFEKFARVSSQKRNLESLKYATLELKRGADGVLKDVKLST